MKWVKQRAVNQCTSMKELRLYFPCGDNKPLYAGFATNVHLPNLVHLELRSLGCELSALQIFLRKHLNTLRACGVFDWRLTDTAGVGNFCEFLAELRHSFSLKRLILSEVEQLDGNFHFSGACCVALFEEAEQWTSVECDSRSIWLKDEELQEGISEAIETIRIEG